MCDRSRYPGSSLWLCSWCLSLGLPGHQRVCDARWASSSHCAVQYCGLPKWSKQIEAAVLSTIGGLACTLLGVSGCAASGGSPHAGGGVLRCGRTGHKSMTTKCYVCCAMMPTWRGAAVLFTCGCAGAGGGVCGRWMQGLDKWWMMQGLNLWCES